MGVESGGVGRNVRLGWGRAGGWRSVEGPSQGLGVVCFGVSVVVPRGADSLSAKIRIDESNRMK